MEAAANAMPQQAPLEHGFLMFVAENSGIFPEDLEQLFYNGFDNPESFLMVTEEQLRSIGVQEDALLLMDKIMATVEVYRDYVSKNGPYVSATQQPAEDLSSH